MIVKIIANEKENPVGKLADAELHFTDGALDGLKLIGFSVWERRGASQSNSTLDAFSRNGLFNPRMPIAISLIKTTLTVIA